MKEKSALVIVDIQNDFVPGGALAIKDGDKVVPVINQLLEKKFDLKIGTKDWHPADHSSFAANHHKTPGEVIQLNGLKQILWPVHCVQNTPGADWVKDLNTVKFDHTIYKGMDRNIDSYSAFFDNGHKKATGLHEYLQKKGINTVYFAGLATDYCVRYSVLDAINLGYKTYVVVDGCRGVNLNKNDSQDALHELKAAGSQLVYAKDIIAY